MVMFKYKWKVQLKVMIGIFCVCVCVCTYIYDISVTDTDLSPADRLHAIACSYLDESSRNSWRLAGLGDVDKKGKVRRRLDTFGQLVLHSAQGGWTHLVR